MCVSVCVCVYLCMYVYIYVCVYVFLCVYACLSYGFITCGSTGPLTTLYRLDYLMNRCVRDSGLL